MATTRTEGTKDTVVINQPKGKYRAVMPAQGHHERNVSKVVTLSR